jgi:hypothetical protein
MVKKEKRKKRTYLNYYNEGPLTFIAFITLKGNTWGHYHKINKE